VVDLRLRSTQGRERGKVMGGDTASPIYEAVVRDLRIDPEGIAARPEWSFEVANENLRKHRQEGQRHVLGPKPETEAAQEAPHPKVG
jgi:hypothetical protein